MWRGSARSLIVYTALGIAGSLLYLYLRRRHKKGKRSRAAGEEDDMPPHPLVVLPQNESDGRLDDVDEDEKCGRGGDSDADDDDTNEEEDEVKRLSLVKHVKEQRTSTAPDTVDNSNAIAVGAGCQSRRRALVVEDSTTCNDLMSSLVRSLQAASDRVVGIDCEWVTDRATKARRPVSLLQLATGDVCLLLRLHKLSGDERSLPACVQALLADESVVKVGVAVLEDAAKLKADYNVVVESCVDLRHLAGSYAQDWSRLGLKDLCSAVLGITMDKNAAVRCGDWEADTLSEPQVHYASQDAFVALDIYQRLMYLIKETSAATTATVTESAEAPSAILLTRLASTSSDANGIARNGLTVQLPASVSNSSHKDVAAAVTQLPSATNSAVATAKRNARRTVADAEQPRPEEDVAAETSAVVDQQQQPPPDAAGPDGSVKASSKNAARPSSSRTSNYPTYSLRKRPMYDNCVMQAPDGKPLSTCNTKKARWYLDRGIAVLVADEPLTIRLLHEPRGRLDESQLRYYTAPKQNACVVCGNQHSYVRKHVVPREYRRHFPVKMKDHSSHDILLLCASCHQRCDAFDSEFKLQLAVIYDAPIRRSQGLCRVDEARRDAVKVASIARALLKSGDRIPPDRRAEYEQLLRTHLGEDGAAELTEAALRAIVLSLDPDRSAKSSSSSTTNVAALVEESATTASGDVAAVATVAAAAAAVDGSVAGGTVSRESDERHGYKVVQQVLRRGELAEFERQWRQRFVTLMAPRHLPPFWSVDYCHVPESGSDGGGDAEPRGRNVERLARGEGDASADRSLLTAERSC